MNEFEEKLLEYIEETLSYEGEGAKRDWVFGAVDFAHSKGFITDDKAEEFYQKYKLF